MKPNLITLTDPSSQAAEAYRRLRANLMSAGRESALRTLLVAATDAAGGAIATDKATVVANLAVAYAKVGTRVILADCDLRHPAQHTLFGLANTTGVTTAAMQASLQASLSIVAHAALPLQALPLQGTDIPGLRVLTSGPAVAVPSDLLASHAMSELLSRLLDEADVVLLDAPPVTVATDAAELATQVDGVLLIVAAGQTKRDDAQHAKEVLAQVGARVVGVALVNVAPDADSRKYLATAAAR